MREQELLNLISINHGEECLILIRDKYYKALAQSCSVCGLDFKILEDHPSDLDFYEGWDGSVIMGSQYVDRIKLNPAVIIPDDGNNINFWRKKDA